jgi:hypothetical protein
LARAEPGTPSTTEKAGSRSPWASVLASAVSGLVQPTSTPAPSATVGWPGASLHSKTAPDALAGNPFAVTWITFPFARHVAGFAVTCGPDPVEVRLSALHVVVVDVLVSPTEPDAVVVVVADPPVVVVVVPPPLEAAANVIGTGSTWNVEPFAETPYSTTHWSPAAICALVGGHGYFAASVAVSPPLESVASIVARAAPGFPSTTERLVDARLPFASVVASAVNGFVQPTLTPAPSAIVGCPGAVLHSRIAPVALFGYFAALSATVVPLLRHMTGLTVRVAPDAGSEFVCVPDGLPHAEPVVVVVVRAAVVVVVGAAVVVVVALVVVVVLEVVVVVGATVVLVVVLTDVVVVVVGATVVVVVGAAVVVVVPLDWPAKVIVTGVASDVVPLAETPYSITHWSPAAICALVGGHGYMAASVAVAPPLESVESIDASPAPGVPSTTEKLVDARLPFASVVASAVSGFVQPTLTPAPSAMVGCPGAVLHSRMAPVASAGYPDAVTVTVWPLVNPVLGLTTRVSAAAAGLENAKTAPMPDTSSTATASGARLPIPNRCCMYFPRT